MPKNKQVNMGYLEIPDNYFELTKEDKDIVCTVLMDTILKVIDKDFNPMYNRIDILEKIIDSSIITNQQEEKYEICAVLKDIRNLIHAPEDK